MMSGHHSYEGHEGMESNLFHPFVENALEHSNDVADLLYVHISFFPEEMGTGN